MERLVRARLAERERHDPAAARDAGWERGSRSARAAQDLATWGTAGVTGTGFNEDEGPRADGPVRITPACTDAVHRWPTGQGDRIRGTLPRGTRCRGHPSGYPEVSPSGVFGPARRAGR